MISKKKIQEITDILAATYQPKMIYLFGSYAWGTPTQDSDIDFLIVVDSNFENNFESRRKGNRALAGKDIAIDFMFIEQNMFSKRAEHVSSLEFKVKKEGIIVYDTSRAMAF